MSSYLEESPESSQAPSKEHIEHCLITVAEGIVSNEWRKVALLAGVVTYAETFTEYSDKQNYRITKQSEWTLDYPDLDDLNR